MGFFHRCDGGQRSHTVPLTTSHEANVWKRTAVWQQGALQGAKARLQLLHFGISKKFE